MFGHSRVRFARIRVLAALLLLLITNIGAVGASTVAAAPSCDQVIRFGRDIFSNPTRIDNTFLPLVPGTQFILQGTANNGSGPLPHRVVFTVTDVTKVIDGVRTVVVWDQDLDSDQLAESELAFFAQDNGGNVWNLGEYPEEYEGGVFVGAPSTWITGVAGAKAGIHMLSDPKVGTPSYLQGRSPTISFLDCAQVFETGQSVSVPVSSYDHVLVTNEWSPLDRGSGIQRKYYAPGVGNIQVTAVDDPEGETLAVVKIVHLNPHALAEVREQALKLDRHAYEVSNVYRDTPPAE